MNEDLLKYYNRELTFIRRMGTEFAEKYPKVAGRLRISDEQVEDPHVSRLIEAFALLTAQIRQKLDDSFPELTDALLGQLYPDYQAPIPSFSVLQLTSQNLSDSGITIKRGTEFKTKVDGMKPCMFRSCYDTEVWPMTVDHAEYKNSPFNAPQPPGNQSAKALLRLQLTTEFDNTAIDELGVGKLRFYLNGQRHHVYSLYEMLNRQLLRIGIAAKEAPNDVCYLAPEQLKAVGFDDAERVVPYTHRSFTGYRLLVEQFLFPEKFLFVELSGLEQTWPEKASSCYIYLYFSEPNAELERHITKDSLLLGCTPVLNIFEQKLEPINFERSHYEYRLAPQYLDADICEVLQIEQVQLLDSDGQKTSVHPYYSQGHPNYVQQENLFWHSRREFADWAGGYSEAGTEVFLSLVDRSFQHSQGQGGRNDQVIQVTALCSNRNLPNHLPFGGGEPGFQILQHADVIKQSRCLLAPTMPIRPALGDSSRWQLVKHLTLNYFTAEDAEQRLKETLRLYDFRCTPESKALIDGIHKVQIHPGTARVNDKGRVAVCSGSEILIEMTQAAYAGSNVFFFASVLDHFFAQFAAVNSYTRLTIKLKEHEQHYHTWPARVGNKVLL